MLEGAQLRIALDRRGQPLDPSHRDAFRKLDVRVQPASSDSHRVPGVKRSADDLEQMLTRAPSQREVVGEVEDGAALRGHGSSVILRRRGAVNRQVRKELVSENGEPKRWGCDCLVTKMQEFQYVEI